MDSSSASLSQHELSFAAVDAARLLAQKKKSSVAARNKRGMTALHIAVMADNIPVLRALLLDLRCSVVVCMSSASATITRLFRSSTTNPALRYTMLRCTLDWTLSSYSQKPAQATRLVTSSTSRRPIMRRRGMLTHCSPSWVDRGLATTGM